MIEVKSLTKHYGPKLVVHDVTFSVEPGRITGFLGPNGAGKSTTLRIILGLTSADTGQALVDGVPYRSLAHPMRKVGALLEADAIHPRRTARNHLRALGTLSGADEARVETVLETVGLVAATNTRGAEMSLGMRQRLGIGAALLGDPEVLILDEPMNGLDPDGIRWMRALLKDRAAEGKAVLISSHLLGEMSTLADHLLVISKGKMVADLATKDLLDQQRPRLLVRTIQAETLQVALEGRCKVTLKDDTLTLEGITAQEVGQVALDNQVVLEELRGDRSTLEEAFFNLTKEALPT